MKSLREVNWICHECALVAGAKTIEGHIASYHEDTCGVCGESRVVTEPRDYFWPKGELA